MFNRKSETSETTPIAAEAPHSAENPQLGCRVAEITSQEREQFDQDDEKQGLYQHAGDIIQDVVLLGTPIGIDVRLSVPSSIFNFSLVDPCLGKSSPRCVWQTYQWVL